MRSFFTYIFFLSSCYFNNIVLHAKLFHHLKNPDEGLLKPKRYNVEFHHNKFITFGLLCFSIFFPHTHTNTHTHTHTHTYIYIYIYIRIKSGDWFCLSTFLLIFSHLVGFTKSTISPYIYIYIVGWLVGFMAYQLF